MKIAVAFIAVLAPLIITPGLLLSYEIAPKVAALAIGACLLLWCYKGNLSRIQEMWRTSRGRWFVGLLAAQWIVVAIATALSSSPALSLNGSSWRRFGLFTQTCVILAGLLTAAWISEDRSRIRTILRMCTGAGAFAALYGVLQYFGFDPLIPFGAYHAGEGPFTIVRPPGTLGHADYFAAWLVLVFFAAVAMASMEETRSARVGAQAAAISTAVAILLTGTRGALLGLVAGILILVLMRHVQITVRLIGVALASAACLIAFFFSPLGAQLRARMHWSIHEPLGGARLLLWRDSLAMAVHRFWTGFGPETFSTQFPRFQSLALARAYPDFYHESPHNIYLDVLTAQGAAGLLAMLGLTILGFCTYRRLDRRYAAPVIAGWAAFLVCNQFVVLIAPTAAYFYLWLAILIGGTYELSAAAHSVKSSTVYGKRLALTVVAAATCLTLVIYAVRLMSADRALADMRVAMESGRSQLAAQAYQRAVEWQPGGQSADLYYSRGMAQVAGRSRDPRVRSTSWQSALDAGARAVQVAEDRQNAWYNMAALFAAQNDADDSERCLRNAISVAPNWFKPHWTLARLLAVSHRNQEAIDEASAAVERNGGHNAEVLETWSRLKQSIPTNH